MGIRMNPFLSAGRSQVCIQQQTFQFYDEMYLDSCTLPDCGTQRTLQEVFEVPAKGVISPTNRQRLTEAIKQNVPLNISLSSSPLAIILMCSPPLPSQIPPLILQSVQICSSSTPFFSKVNIPGMGISACNQASASYNSANDQCTILLREFNAASQGLAALASVHTH